MSPETLFIPIVVVSLLVGLVVARWWVVLTPVALLVALVVGVAVMGSENSDGEGGWFVTLFVGAFLALFAVCGLLVGVVWGRLIRERRARPTSG